MPASDLQLIEQARKGDESAYQDLVEAHRRELHAHCYRMLGSVQDAEDALQDALLRAWRGLNGFQGRSSPRSWLYKIATNTCLDTIARRPKRVLPFEYGPATAGASGPGEPITESIWIEPYPDELIGLQDGLRLAGGAIRGARERRAGVRRRPAAPAGAPARRADPARGAGLLGRRGGRAAGHDGGVGQQRAAARPRRHGRAPARPEPAADAAHAGRRGDHGDRRPLRGGVGAQRRRGGRLAADGGRGDLDAAAGQLVRAAGRDGRVPGLLPA